MRGMPSFPVAVLGGRRSPSAVRNHQPADRARRSRSTPALCSYSRLQIEALRAVAKATQAM
jgi:hypothetical protein